MAQLHNAFRSRQVAQRMCAEVVQPGVLWQMVEHHRLRRTRQQRLAAVAKIAKPCGAIDRRADVVALVAQLDLTGVHADPQPDRCERRTLQRQRTRDGVTGARERDHKTVTLALLDGTHAVVNWRPGPLSVASSRAIAAVIASGWVSQSWVEPSTSASSSDTVPVGSPLTAEAIPLLTSAGSLHSSWLMLASMRPRHGANISASAYF